MGKASGLYHSGYDLPGTVLCFSVYDTAWLRQSIWECHVPEYGDFPVIPGFCHAAFYGDLKGCAETGHLP